MEPLNLMNLKYFCDAVRLGGISASAKENFVTQSAVSQAIGKLEQFLHVKLIAHHPNRLRITPEGEATYKNGLSILNQASLLQGRLKNDEASQLGCLQFTSSYSFALAVLPEILKKFRRDYPLVEIKFSLGTFQEVHKKVKMGLFDFGVLPDDGDLSEFQTREILRGHFGTFVSTKVPSEQIQELPFILPGQDRPELNLFKKSYESQFHKYPPVFMEVNSWETVAKFTSEGLGIGYFPNFIAKRKDYHLRPLDLGITRFPLSMKMIYPKGNVLRKSSEIFCSYFDH